jgi:phosphoglycolate phosphatase-like HAD superfamily hydrolase
MKLVILDVDGTLTETSDLDTDCFMHALEDCFALTGIETDWSVYTHSTDAGILEELFQKHFKRSPSAAEIARLQSSFVGHLQRVFDYNDLALVFNTPPRAPQQDRLPAADLGTLRKLLSASGLRFHEEAGADGMLTDLGKMVSDHGVDSFHKSAGSAYARIM